MQGKLLLTRKASNKSQADLNKFLGIETYGQKEREKQNFTIVEMYKLSRLFGKGLDELFSEPDCINNRKGEL